MVKASELMVTVKEISDFLIRTQDESNLRLACYLMKIGESEHLKNYVNYNEACLVIAEYGEWELAEKCLDIAENEISLVDECICEKNHYAHIVAAIELMKINKLENDVTPSLKNKYLYVLKFTNGTVKIGITKEKDKRMKAISSASGMDIVKSYFTEKIDRVQDLETELHRFFNEKRLKGEFFNLDFDEAVAEVERRKRKYL